MTLKNARLARAENLSPQQQGQIGQAEGLIVIESHNPDLTEKIIPIKSGGIREYLLHLAGFKEDPA